MKMLPLLRVSKMILAPLFGLFAPTIAIGKKRKYYKNIQPIVLIGNHLANIDTVVCGLKHKRQIYYLGKKELMRNKFVAAVLRGLGIIPVDRGQADLAAMRTVINHLKAGDDIAIYPEGTRNKVDSRLCKMMGGAAFFAIKTKTAIVPFAFNKPARFLKKNYMVFGDPFELNSFYERRLDNETTQTADAVVRDRLIRVKRIADYFASKHGKKKRLLKKRLNDPNIPFDDIYKECEPNLPAYDVSVAPEDFDQRNKPKKSKKHTEKTPHEKPVA